VKKVNKNDLVVVIGDNNYSFNAIKRRTTHAPVIKISILAMVNVLPSGIDEIDNSDIRIVKLNKVVYLLSGFNKVKDIITNYYNDIKNINNADDSMSVFLMSPAYLETTLMPPKVITAEELVSVAAKLKERFSSFCRA
jgi:hypothetical protein